ncbi:hypothetical protein COE98_01470 [Bacillus wiedmannii]|uniref:glycosyltransferase n=2 Tax=Bacillus wiedmannii TaxID=1890302 RepID=UPI000BFBF001|nr:glycosyltransferase [Bacillus wiedmannii]PHB95630.1 hypothetical protein COE98_01470 [Bacillus wiedmannii]
MYKVYLTDNTLTGHHKVYLDTLLHVKNTMNFSYCTEFENNKKKLGYILDRKRFVQDIVEKIKSDKFQGQKVLHLLYLDNLYTLPFFLIKNNSISIKVVGTLHHMPQNKVKMALLKICSKKLDRIIVHSDYIKEQLLLEGIKNVEVVDYPSFYDYSIYPSKEKIKNNWNISNEKIIFSVLGGTRFDKGIDILLESFKYLNQNHKDEILLNIVGKEETFDKKFIMRKIEQFKINARVELGFVDDEDFAKNVLISDYIVLPYRMIFTGNSGPMTEAIVNKIPVITPNFGNLGYLTEKYHLGEVFKIEDCQSLALTLERCLQNKQYDYEDYWERLNVSHFNSRYNEIYNTLFK